MSKSMLDLFKIKFIWVNFGCTLENSGLFNETYHQDNGTFVGIVECTNQM